MLPKNLPHYLSPAKLNLDLRIIGRRTDGYHELESIFTLIDLYDTLCLTPRNDKQIVLHTPTPNLLPENDLTVRAAHALQQASGSLHGANIWLNKRIPMGSGLGGGSSNAATVLIVLNHLWQCHFNQQQLIDIGVKLGADVPFFIFGQTAFARGIGEKLQPIDIPNQFYLLIHPNEHVSTSEIFAAPDLPRHSSRCIHPTWNNLQPLRNDIQPIVLKRYSKIQAAFQWLTQYGEPRMTGSGACLFLPCNNHAHATHIQTTQPENLSSWIVRNIPNHPLYPLLSNI